MFACFVIGCFALMAFGAYLMYRGLVAFIPSSEEEF